MKAKEEVLDSAVKDYFAKMPSMEAWLKSRFTGVWNNGLHHSKAESAKEREEAYQKGMADAEMCDIQKSCSESYQNGYDKGMEDAWNVAKRVMGMSIEEWDECFGEDVFPLDKFEASEATQILKEWIRTTAQTAAQTCEVKHDTNERKQNL